MTYTHAHTASIALKLAHRGQLPLIFICAIQFADTVVTWKDRYNSRRDLSTMSFGQLEDIGVTPDQALIEQHKPFWRA